MKRHWIECTDAWTPSPLTYWVYVPSESDPATFQPPAPARQPGKGYAVYFAEVDGFVFQFASLVEMRVCIDTLGKKLLPNTLRLAHERGADPAEHWLRKMPEHTKPWRHRGFRRGKVIVIPGLKNKLGAFSVRLAPRSSVRKPIKRLQR